MKHRKQLVTSIVLGSLALLLLLLWALFHDAGQTLKPESVPPSGAADWLADNEFYTPRLKLGMTKLQVAALVPPPQNRDTENVWMWVNRFSAGAEIGRLNRDELSIGRDGFFVIFINDKLVTPLRALSAFTEAEALSDYLRIPLDQAKALLHGASNRVDSNSNPP